MQPIRKGGVTKSLTQLHTDNPKSPNKLPGTSNSTANKGMGVTAGRDALTKTFKVQNCRTVRSELRKPATRGKRF